jgi:lipoprotein NlpI
MASKDVSLFYKKAVILFEKGEYEKSLQVLQTILNIDKKFLPAWNCKAVAHLELHDYPMALESFENIIQRDPGDNLAWYNKGYVLQLMEEYAESKKVFDFFLARYDKKNDAFYKFALYLQAKNCLNLKEYEDALISVDNALDLDENFKEALELKKTIKNKLDNKK